MSARQLQAHDITSTLSLCSLFAIHHVKKNAPLISLSVFSTSRQKAVLSYRITQVLHHAVWSQIAASEEVLLTRSKRCWGHRGAEVNHVGGVMTSAESGAALCSHLLVNISQRNEFAWSLETVVSGRLPAADHYKWLGLFSLRITKASEIPSSVPIPHAALLQGQINKWLYLGQKMVQSTFVTRFISDHPLYLILPHNWIMTYLIY